MGDVHGDLTGEGDRGMTARGVAHGCRGQTECLGDHRLETAAAGGDLVGLERVVLGLCVEYPDLFEAAAERLLELDFGLEPHEAFKRELDRLASRSDDLSVSSFYAEIDPRFFFLLEEVHGAEVVDEDGRVIEPSGGRLRSRFKVLKFHPPESWVETCLWHFLDRLELRQMERDLEREVSQVGAEADEAVEARILGMSRDIGRRREEFARREQELAEEAKDIRRAHGESAPATGIAAGGVVGRV